MDQFRDLRAHPISRRLISSCRDTLRTCLQDPCDLPPWTEAQNCYCNRKSYIENAGEPLETEHRVDISRAKKGAHVEVVYNSVVLIL
jgi:hypothetical protein